MQNLIDNIQIERQIKKLRGIRKISNTPMYLRVLPYNSIVLFNSTVSSNLTLPLDHSEHNYKDNTILPLDLTLPLDHSEHNYKDNTTDNITIANYQLINLTKPSVNYVIFTSNDTNNNYQYSTTYQPLYNVE